jgi:putative ABC transport system permease protein
VTSVLQDTRYALRLLRRQPAYALFVAATLAVGIAAVTAVFSVVNAVLLRPLPFDRSEDLVAVRTYFRPESGFDFPNFPMSAPEYLDYRNATRALEGLAAYTETSATIGGDGAEPERVSGTAVTRNLFEVLRAKPLVGHIFSAADDRPNASPTLILSYGYWQSRFSGNPDVVGRTILVNGRSTEIVGVMPAGFAYPGPSTRFWSPLGIDEANPGGRASHYLTGIGRLAPGATVGTARAEVETLMAAWRADDVKQYTGHGMRIEPKLQDQVSGVRRALLLLFGATALLLLVVCANVVSIVLARGEGRTREMAIRGALGAGRWRLVRLTLVESALLAAVGGAAGVALAWAGVPMLLAIDVGSLPRSAEVGLDGRVLLFATGASIASAMVFGLLPAHKGSAFDLQLALRADARTASESADRLWVRNGLVAAEVALAFVLVVGAGLMLRSLGRLLDVDPGFEPQGVLLARVSLPASSYEDAARVQQFYDDLLARVRAASSVRSASASAAVPILSSLGVWDFQIEGKPAPAQGQPAWNAAFVAAHAGFLETIGARLLRGRTIRAEDTALSEPVVVINQTLASRFFAGEDPIGRRLRVRGPQRPWMTVVGVVGDMHNLSLDDPPQPMYIAPDVQAPATGGFIPRGMTIAARTDGPTETVVAAIRAAVHQLDPGLPVYGVQTYDAVIGDSLGRPRFLAALLGLFAVVGLVLGASGIYGVLAYSVARRSQEIGIRRALGASTREVASRVVRQGMAPVVAGLTAGVLAALGATRLMATLLFDVAPTDVTTYVEVAAAMILVAIAACILPARRAIRVDPLAAIRAE